MSEFLEIPQFVVSPPNFEVMQQGLALINSESELLPQIAGLSPYQQAELLEQWYALHDPTYLSTTEYEDLFFSTNVNDLKNFAEQGIKDIYAGVGSSEAAKEWIVEGGKVTSTGAAVAGEKIAYDYATSLAASSSGSTSVMAILSMNLPTAAAAMAPLIGFSLGWTLYELAPEFWEKVSRALLPFCYEDTELMPVMADDKGITYYPKAAVDALQVVFSENVSTGLYKAGTDASYESDPYPFLFEVTDRFVYNITTDINAATVIKTDRPVSFTILRIEDHDEVGKWAYSTYISSSASFRWGWGTYAFEESITLDKYVITTDYNGTKIYWAVLTTGDTTNNIEAQIPVNTFTNLGRGADIPAMMVIGISPAGTEIDGVSKWEGVKYPANVNSIEILGPVNKDRTDYTKTQYIPIATPYGSPGESVQSTITDLTINSDPVAAINPWISARPSESTYPNGAQSETKPAPLPSILPNQNPVSNPQENPSDMPENKPEQDANTPTPGDSGSSNQPQNPDSIPFLPGDGIVHVYNPTASELRAFGSWLWKTFSGDIIETVSKLFNNPMDSLIGLHELYASPNIAGTDNIKCGYLTSNVPSKYVGNRYSSINCGSIVVPEFYNNYLDYSPYTKCFIYLPFVGIVPVHADDIIGNAVNISYNIDAYTGSCIAIITVAREGYSSTVYQFQGNCAAELPISSGYHSALMAGLLGVAGTAISGNPHVGLSAANLGRASLGKNEVSHSGSFGATYGAMGAKAPYIIVKRPTQRNVVNYNEDYGFPAHKRVTIGACTGYLRAREVHIISSTATDEEKIKIEELLKSGVYIE